MKSNFFKLKDFFFNIKYNMFFPMTPEMIQNLNELKKKSENVKAPMSFEAYYNKRFMEECKYFVENPKFSIKYAMVMSYLQKDIREKALKEYKQKWPNSPIEQLNNKFPYIHNIKQKKKENDTESVSSDYDIIDEDDTQSVHSEFEELNNDTKPNIRRSKRLQNKLLN